VLIAGSRIVAVGTDERIETPNNAQRVDGTGKFLMPGLWEMHGHVDDGAAWQLPTYLALGITGIRDMGSRLEQVEVWKRAGQDSALMPRIVAAGPIVIGLSRDPDPRVVRAQTTREARQVVDSLARGGVDFIKVYDWLPRDVYFALARAARRHRLPIAGHLPVMIDVQDAMRARQRSIEHDGNAVGGLLLHAAADRSHLERARALVGRAFDPSFLVGSDDARLAGLLASYSDTKADSLARLLARANIFVTPTIVGYAVYQLPADTLLLTDERRAYVPETWLTLWDDMIRGYNSQPPMSDTEELRKRLVETRARLLRSLYRAHVPILAGTDLSPWPGAFPGWALHDELVHLVMAGLKPQDALRAATLNPARYFNATDSLGTITRRRVADLVLLDANPLADIRNTRRVHAVFLHGRYLDRTALDTLLVRARAAAAALPVQ
jgi:amidohydrolase family protein